MSKRCKDNGIVPLRNNWIVRDVCFLLLANGVLSCSATEADEGTGATLDQLPSTTSDPASTAGERVPDDSAGDDATATNGQTGGVDEESGADETVEPSIGDVSGWSNPQMLMSGDWVQFPHYRVTSSRFNDDLIGMLGTETYKQTQFSSLNLGFLTFDGGTNRWQKGPNFFYADENSAFKRPAGFIFQNHTSDRQFAWTFVDDDDNGAKLSIFEPGESSEPNDYQLSQYVVAPELRPGERINFFDDKSWQKMDGSLVLLAHGYAFEEEPEERLFFVRCHDFADTGCENYDVVTCPDCPAKSVKLGQTELQFSSTGSGVMLSNEYWGFIDTEQVWGESVPYDEEGGVLLDWTRPVGTDLIWVLYRVGLEEDHNGTDVELKLRRMNLLDGTSFVTDSSLSLSLSAGDFEAIEDIHFEDRLSIAASEDRFSWLFISRNKKLDINTTIFEVTFDVGTKSWVGPTTVKEFPDNSDGSPRDGIGLATTMDSSGRTIATWRKYSRPWVHEWSESSRGGDWSDPLTVAPPVDDIGFGFRDGQLHVTSAGEILFLFTTMDGHKLLASRRVGG